jgi:hypothetical protein
VCEEDPKAAGVNGEPDELASLRDKFPGYRFRRRKIRGALCYVAEGGNDAPAKLAAASNPAILADMLSVALGRPVRLRAAAVVAAYRDQGMTLKQCAKLFGVSRTTISNILAAQQIPPRKPGDGIDDRAVITAYRDRRLSLHATAAQFNISPRRVTTILTRHNIPRRPVGRPPRPPPPRPPVSFPMKVP